MNLEGVGANKHARSNADFYLVLKNVGFECVVLTHKWFFKGLKLTSVDSAFVDFRIKHDYDKVYQGLLPKVS